MGFGILNDFVVATPRLTQPHPPTAGPTSPWKGHQPAGVPKLSQLPVLPFYWAPCLIFICSWDQGLGRPLTCCPRPTFLCRLGETPPCGFTRTLPGDLQSPEP